MNIKDIVRAKLRKASNLPLLKTLDDISPDTFKSLLEERLEKMARSNIRQHVANPMLSHFASNLRNNSYDLMLHDALSHHGSQYLGALKNGDIAVANKHLHKFLKHLNIADKMEYQVPQASQGQDDFPVNYVPIQPWEANKYKTIKDVWDKNIADAKQAGTYTKDEDHMPAMLLNAKNYTIHHPSSEPKGIAVAHIMAEKHGSITPTKAHDQEIRDTDPVTWMNSTPHALRGDEIRGNPHESGYHNKHWPLEETQVERSYVNLNPDSYKGGYVAHPLDNHPIHKFHSIPAKDVTDKDMDKYLNEENKFMSEPTKNGKSIGDMAFDRPYIQHLAQLKEQHPTNWHNTNKFKPQGHYPDVPELDLDHARHFTEQARQDTARLLGRQYKPTGHHGSNPTQPDLNFGEIDHSIVHNHVIGQPAPSAQTTPTSPVPTSPKPGMVIKRNPNGPKLDTSSLKPRSFEVDNE